MQLLESFLNSSVDIQLVAEAANEAHRQRGDNISEVQVVDEGEVRRIARSVYLIADMLQNVPDQEIESLLGAYPYYRAMTGDGFENGDMNYSYMVSELIKGYDQE